MSCEGQPQHAQLTNNNNNLLQLLRQFGNEGHVSEDNNIIVNHPGLQYHTVVWSGDHSSYHCHKYSMQAT